jgi:hypothetical protein
MSSTNETDLYGPMVAIGSMFIGAALATSEDDEKRKRRMRTAISDQRAQYIEAFKDSPGAPVVSEACDQIELLQALPTDWAPHVSKTYVADLLFASPFYPAQLKWDNDRREAALTAIAVHIGLSAEIVYELTNVRKSAMKAHRHIDWKKIGLIGASGLVLVGITAGVAAPFIAMGIGGAAGLAGAAALAHGLAVLGFGSLAVGGFGMAGGLWLVTAAGATAGVTAASVAALLSELGAEGAVVEITKMQVVTKVVTIPSSHADAVATVGSLTSDREELRILLAAALERNEDDSAAVEDLEAIELALTDAIKWINNEIEES